MKYSFCTYFDSNYACLGISLYNSLRAHVDDFELYVCCLEDRIYAILEELSLPQIKLIRLSEIEAFDPEFHSCRNNRSIVEYYFTLSPILPRYIFDKNPNVEVLTYLDSDLFFFHSPKGIYDEFGNSSLSLIEHRFPEKLKFREKYGKYNLAFQIYRNDKNTEACLSWWREQCLKWCFDRLEGDKFADQKYLEKWEELFDGVKVIEHKGAGIAPWNWSNYSYSLNSEPVLVDDDPLIFYHYQGIRVLNKYVLCHNLGSYKMNMPRSLRNFFYCTYFNALKEAEKILSTSASYNGLSMKSSFQRSGFSKLYVYLAGIKNRDLMFTCGC